jgi:hypothetical protein
MSDTQRIIYEGKKTPFNYEIMHRNGELGYAKGLDEDETVLAWTKKHNIIIKYRNKKGGISRYFPDFLIRRKNQNHLEIVEIKGAHLRHDPDVELKKRAAEDWCRQRGMSYRLIVVG